MLCTSRSCQDSPRQRLFWSLNLPCSGSSKDLEELPIIDNALYVGDVNVDPGYLQTMVSLINDTAYKNFLEMIGLVLTFLKGTLALSRLCGTLIQCHLCGCSHSMSHQKFFFILVHQLLKEIFPCARDCEQAQPVKGQSL